MSTAREPDADQLSPGLRQIQSTDNPSVTTCIPTAIGWPQDFESPYRALRVLVQIGVRGQTRCVVHIVST